MTNALQVELLVDNPEALPILKEWFEREWEPYYGSEGSGDANNDLMDSCNRDELPIAMVAILGGEICGTVALKVESVATLTFLGLFTCVGELQITLIMVMLMGAKGLRLKSCVMFPPPATATPCLVMNW